MTATLPNRAVEAAVSPQPAALAYEGTVVHHRRAGPTREFTPRVFLAYLDVDALPAALDPMPLWSARRLAPVRYHRRDFFDGGERPLGDAVRDLVNERLGYRPSGRVFLLAHLRTFGWLHNPLAVYYCWSSSGTELEALVLEVTNTPWGERQWYVFDARHRRNAARTPKVMHVSPFLPMDVEYRVSWTAPGAGLSVRIEVERAGKQLFFAALDLRRVHLDRRHAVALVARYPFLTGRVSAAIYRQALALFLRRTPVYRHPEVTP